MDDQTQKAYILTLTFEREEKRVWFTGKNDEETERKFKQASDKLNIIGDECSYWNQFLKGAIDHFSSYGFTRIKK